MLRTLAISTSTNITRREGNKTELATRQNTTSENEQEEQQQTMKEKTTTAPIQDNKRKQERDQISSVQTKQSVPGS